MGDVHDPAPWYPITAPPPPRVMVRLTGNRGYVVEGWHDNRNLQGLTVPWWFERRGRVMAPLERVLPQPTGRYSPTAWQPLDAAVWCHDLPAPCDPTYGPRRVVITAVIAAPDPPMSDPVAAFEVRLLQAFRVDAALPDTDRARLRVRANWPETRPGPGDYPPEARTRFRPTPQMVDDYLVVMRHVARLSRKEIKCMRLRALGYGYRWISEGMGIDENDARKLYGEARWRCWKFAVAAGDAGTGLEGSGKRARHDSGVPHRGHRWSDNEVRRNGRP